MTSQRICPGCGAASAPGARFCQRCGAGLGEPSPAPPQPGPRHAQPAETGPTTGKKGWTCGGCIAAFIVVGIVRYIHKSNWGLDDLIEWIGNLFK
ncbi:MAG: hypothetical protein ACYSUM_20100 [Planctomycetota bacterium]|jgi:hypothetical protein